MIVYVTADGLGSPWIGNELRQVEVAGIPFRLYALRRPTRISHEADWARIIDEGTHAIYPLPILSLAHNSILAPFRFGSRYFAALANALFGQRESFRTRVAAVAHFFVAAHWAITARRENIDHIHAQWAHSGCTVAMYGAWLLNRPFSFTGHAVDLFRQRVALDDKIRRAAFIVCISEFHRRFFIEHGADPAKLVLAYCGIDLALFAPRRRREPDAVFTILSAGRLIEKKGFQDLISACAILKKRGSQFRCIIGGSGPLEGALQEQIDALSLKDFVWLTGNALTQESIPAFMSQGDVFCLPCVWARDQDVDGLPQLLMEAMACGLPAISTRIVGIPDLIIHNETGLLVAPASPDELASALQFAIQNPDAMANFGKRGLKHLRKKFDLGTSLEPLLERYRLALGVQHRDASPKTHFVC